jgi:hypothetical protein
VPCNKANSKTPCKRKRSTTQKSQKRLRGRPSPFDVRTVTAMARPTSNLSQTLEGVVAESQSCRVLLGCLVYCSMAHRVSFIASRGLGAVGVSFGSSHWIVWCTPDNSCTIVAKSPIGRFPSRVGTRLSGGGHRTVW